MIRLYRSSCGEIRCQPKYVATGNGGYYVAEAILAAYSSIGSLAKVYGAITFILEHPGEIEAYLEDQDRRYESSRPAILSRQV